MTRVPVVIAPEHPAFAGHFPGRPILPGVVLLDESLRAVVAHVAAQHGDRTDGRWHVAQAKFLSFVAPGDPVHVEFERPADPERFRLRVLAGRVGDDDERVAMTGQLTYLAGQAAS